MKTANKLLSVILALCMVISIASVSAFAETEGTITFDRFFEGAGEGFLKTQLNIGGTITDYYVAYGTGPIYTSLDGINWDKRYIDSQSEMPLLRSLAYGNDIGIGVMRYDSKTAYLINKNFNGNPINAGETVRTAMNKVEGEDTWLDLQPHIYYDSYSKLFFCHGLEYKYTQNTETGEYTAGDYTGASLYYTDGAITKETYGAAEANVITWKKISGDWMSLDDEGKVKLSNPATFKRGRITFSGNGSGKIFVCYGVQGLSASTFSSNDADFTGNAVDIRRGASIVTVSVDEATEEKTFSVVRQSSGNIYSAGVLTSDGYIFACNNTNKKLYKLAEKNGAISATNTNKALVDAHMQMIEKNGKIYCIGSDETKIETIVYSGNGSYGAISGALTANLFAENSCSSSYVEAGGDKITDMAANCSAQAITFDKDGNLLIMINNNSDISDATTSARAYIYGVTLPTDTTQAAAKQLTANSTYNNITDGKGSALSSVKGYLIDTGLRASRSETESIEKLDSAADCPVKVTGDISFTGDTAYINSAEKENGTYNVSCFAQLKNQPSIFADKTAEITIKAPYALSGNTLTFAKADEYITNNNAAYECDPRLTNMLVAASVYNTDGTMKAVKYIGKHSVETQDGSALTITAEGNEQVRYFIWENETLTPIFE